MISTRLPIQAAATSPGRLFGDLLPWLFLLAGLAVVGGIVILLVRRWLGADGDLPPAQGFTLQQLRELHASGCLDDAEFEKTKAQLIRTLKGHSQRARDSTGSGEHLPLDVPRSDEATGNQQSPTDSSEESPPASS